MTTKRLWLLLVLVLGLGFVSCGDDDEDVGEVCTALAANGDCTDVKSCCDESDCRLVTPDKAFACAGLDCTAATTELTAYCAPEVTGTLTATVVIFNSNPPKAQEGAKVYALNNTTGEKLAGVAAQTTGADGKVTFEDLPEGNVGILVEKIMDGEKQKTVDSYHYNIPYNQKDKILYSVEKTIYSAVPALAGLTLEAGKGVAAGALYWDDPSSTTDQNAGCLTVEIDPAGGQVRYFGEALPTTIEKQAVTNPVNPKFVIGNMAPGAATLKAMKGTTVVGEAPIVVFPDSICIGNIYVNDSENKNPGSTTACE